MDSDSLLGERYNTDECVRVIEETIFDLKIRNDESNYINEIT